MTAAGGRPGVRSPRRVLLRRVLGALVVLGVTGVAGCLGPPGPEPVPGMHTAEARAAREVADRATARMVEQTSGAAPQAWRDVCAEQEDRRQATYRWRCVVAHQTLQPLTDPRAGALDQHTRLRDRGCMSGDGILRGNGGIGPDAEPVDVPAEPVLDDVTYVCPDRVSVQVSFVETAALGESEAADLERVELRSELVWGTELVLGSEPLQAAELEAARSSGAAYLMTVTAERNYLNLAG